MLKKALLAIGVIFILAAGFVVAKMGPRNVVGMIRYDQRREGDLKVGDRAPESMLISLEGKSGVPLLGNRTRPLVLVFGSFT